MKFFRKMESFTIETDDNTRLTENYPRETVSLVLSVTEEVHKLANKNFLKRKVKIEKEMLKVKNTIKDLKLVLNEFNEKPTETLEEIFDTNDFMRSQKLLIPADLINLSTEKFEIIIQKTLTKYYVSLDKLISRQDSIISIIKEHRESKEKNKKKIAKLILKFYLFKSKK